MKAIRLISILIAALGGEGGGVLTGWIVAAAEKMGFPVQSTSIPGVAQRTGATTYYIEIYPVPESQLGGRRPVMALMPGIGDLDVLLASELAEAARTIGQGFVTPDRTLVLASTGRTFLMPEKTAMGDGRLDTAGLIDALARHARASLMLDMEAVAQASGAMINAVMLGALAGSGALPISPETFAAAIASQGKSSEANLKGFRAGLKAASRGISDAPRVQGKSWRRARPNLAELESLAANFPAAARDLAAEGVRRLAEYQDLAYARLYLNRLGPIAAADQEAGLKGVLLAETARHLALRMSFEDVIRVAQVKADPARLTRIRAEMGAQPGDTLTVTEFLKPGIEEVCSLLPGFLARPILALSERRGWLGYLAWGMEVETTSILGYLRLKALASLRPWRRKTHRFRTEQREIDAWLAAVSEAARLSPDLALAVTQCANLIKGYGDTNRRGTANYRAIFERVVRPALAKRLNPRAAADAVASAYAAALADPMGEGLKRSLAEIESRASLPAAAE